MKSFLTWTKSRSLLLVLTVGLAWSCESDDPDVVPSTKDPEPVEQQDPEPEPETEPEPEPEPNPGPEPTNVPAVERYGQLSVDGNKIVDENGNPVQLHGMSLFWSQWMGQYYNSEAVKWLKDDWRVTLVRAAMGVGSGGYLTNKNAEKEKVKTVVEAAIEEGLYVIIDWHDHHAEDNEEEAVAFFSEMAQLYGEYPNVIYEPYNEPERSEWSTAIKPYHEAVIAAIREHDPDNIVVVGNREWSQQVLEAVEDPIEDENVAYTLHFYAGTHTKWLRDRAQQALDKGFAIIVTEWGTSESSGSGTFAVEETKAWLKWMDDNQISWANWSIADKAETSAALKPGASGKGGWEDSIISPSGLLVRSELRAKNPAPEE